VITLVVYVITAVVVLAGGFYATRRHTVKMLEEAELRKELAEARTQLRYLLQYYQLDIPDPFISKPGFEGLRCHHCNVESGTLHHPICPWYRVHTTFSL
jgi:hypothetical protein